MAFCTSCGGKLPPNAKFCEDCGAPVEPVTQPAPVETGDMTPAPAGQPIVPPAPSRKPVPFLLIIGVLVVFALVAAAVWFVGLPFLQEGQKSSVPTPAPAAVPVTVTTVPTLASKTTVPPVTPTATVRKLDPRYEEYYDEIYTLNEFFAFGQKETFAHDLTTPPLFIKYNLTPVMIIRHRMVDIGLSSERMINTTNPSPYSWFEIRVLDAGTGAVVETQGFGKDYPDVTKHEFMVRNAGNYVIEMSGNDVTADISIMKGKS